MTTNQRGVADICENIQSNPAIVHVNAVGEKNKTKTNTVVVAVLRLGTG